MNIYLNRIARATTLNELDNIVGEASLDDMITNAEYEEVWQIALKAAQNWNVI